MDPVTAYALALPEPWVRVSLRANADPELRRIAAKATSGLPSSVPPDQVEQIRIQVLHRLQRSLREASAQGAREVYLPTADWHGFHHGSAFFVSEVSPSFLPPAEITAENYPATVMAEFLTQPGATAVSYGDASWARTESVIAPQDAQVLDSETVSVSYLGPVPGRPGSWVSVVFSTLGDGQPHSELTRLAVALFDAIMSTWTWTT